MDTQSIGPQIGEGADATVHATGQNVLKLWKDPAAKAPAFIEAQNLTIAASHGLPVPSVHAVGQFNAHWGIIMSRAAGAPLVERANADPDAMLSEMLRLHLAVHAKPEPRLRPLKPKLALAINAATQLDTAQKARLIARLDILPDGQSLCHGDFHPYNIIGNPGETTIIDWLDATSGPPAADVCRSSVILSIVSPDLAEDYVTRYAERSDLTAQEILNWRPIIAAARLREHPPDVENLITMAAEI